MKKPFYALVFIVLLCLGLLVASIVYSAESYQLKTKQSILDKSYRILKMQVGVREIGYNSGIQVQRYLTSVGLPAGYPYCMAGQYYCFKETGQEVPIIKSGNCQTVFNDARRRGKHTAYEVKKHSLLIWQIGYTASGHTERVVEILGMGWVKTIGFNTGINDRDGEGVAEKKRHITNPISRMRVRGTINWNTK